MATRAAVNINGPDGSIIDVTSLGVNNIKTEHLSVGKYAVYGTLGMVPPPLGWGYVLNPADSDALVSIEYTESNQLLIVSVTVNGEPADLRHIFTLHIAVEELPPFILPPVVVDPVASAKEQLVLRNTKATLQIARIQDRIDTIGYGIDAGEATEEDEAEQAALLISIKAWKTYKFALGKVATKPSWPANPEWPTEPPVPVIAADPMSRSIVVEEE